VNHVTCHKKIPDHISNSLTFPGVQNSLTIPGFPGLWEPRVDTTLYRTGIHQKRSAWQQTTARGWNS